MAEPTFPASHLKVERAHGFIAELQRLVKAHVNENPPRITPIASSDGKHTFDIEWANLGLLPGVIVGDVVHNLRTALDLMASDLATRNGRSNKDVYFPIADSEEALTGRISSQKFSKAGDDAVELLRSFRPYRGGDNLLRDLHDLNNADKHTALIAVHSDAGIFVDFVRDPQDENKLIIKPGIERVEIYFPESGPLAGEPIVEMLKQMAELVESVLQAFAGLVNSRA